ncbi:hypothetical protein GPALN_004612 [Globodera pallida]|nr:hypothetical protein GPALN_004612 [Globodera pallida]
MRLDQEMKLDHQEMKLDQQEMKLDQQEMKLDHQEMKLDHQEMELGSEDAIVDVLSSSHSFDSSFSDDLEVFWRFIRHGNCQPAGSFQNSNPFGGFPNSGEFTEERFRMIVLQPPGGE